MPISQSDQLFELIKSLSKSEKRNFTIYATRIQDAEDMKFMQLFEIIDKSKKMDDAAILTKLRTTDKTHYSNLKRYLYTQIMASLRLIFIQKKTEIEIRQLMDFAEILYSKGLFIQSLKIINKTKVLANKTDNNAILLQLIEIEKTIESRHILRSRPNISSQLTVQSKDISNTVINDTSLSNLMMYLHSYYIKNGHAPNQIEADKIGTFFKEHSLENDLNQLHIKSQLYLLQSYVWYYFITQDFKMCLLYAQKWVNLIDSNEDLIFQDPILYMRGHHYILTSSYFLRETERFLIQLEILEKFRTTFYKKLSHSAQIASYLYVHHARLNKAFLLGQYVEGLNFIPQTLSRLHKYRSKLDPHRIMVFYFNIALMYLMARKPSQAIDYLIEIQKMEVGTVRQDIQIYTRIMLLLAHYDLGNHSIIDYLIHNLENIINKVNDQNAVYSTIINGFRKLSKAPILEQKNIFNQLKDNLLAHKTNPYSNRIYIYLDIVAWIEMRSNTALKKQ
jgi:hypothetical protein